MIYGVCGLNDDRNIRVFTDTKEAEEWLEQVNNFLSETEFDTYLVHSPALVNQEEAIAQAGVKKLVSALEKSLKISIEKQSAQKRRMAHYTKCLTEIQEGSLYKNRKIGLDSAVGWAGNALSYTGCEDH